MRARALFPLLLAITPGIGCEQGQGSLEPGAAAGPPNIVWIVADDMSPDLGAYGDEWARTPRLDLLAEESVRFSNAFSVSGVCAPSRSALYTGMYPTTIGSHHMRSWAIPPPYVRIFSQRLREAGYYTTNDRKIDYNLSAYTETPRSSPQPRGRDVQRTVLGPPLGAWDESGEGAHWRNRPDPDQPFFAVFDLFVTHESRIRAPEETFARLTSQLAAEHRHDPQAGRLPPYYPDTLETRRDWARYYDLVSAADIRVGEILAELAADGLADDTVVLFFGDHGRGLPRAKRWLYDSGLRVPLLVRWPGELAPGTVSEELVSFVDFAPTMLALAGLERPGHLQGRVFLGPGREEEPELIFAARDRMDETYDLIRAARDRRYKYLRNDQAAKPYAQPIAYMDQMPTMQVWRRLAAEGRLEGPQQLFLSPRKPPEELYDTVMDRHEIHNLAGDPAHRARLESMRAALARWQAETGDLGALSESELIERMRPAGLDTVAAPVEASPPPGDFTGSVEVTLTSATEGATIIHTTESGETPRWQLYTGSLTLTETTRLRAKAGRLGFLDSDERVLEWSKRSAP